LPGGTEGLVVVFVVLPNVPLLFFVGFVAVAVVVLSFHSASSSSFSESEIGLKRFKKCKSSQHREAKGYYSRLRYVPREATLNLLMNNNAV
jgi:hypothetical protein